MSKKGEHKKAISLLDDAIQKDPDDKKGSRLRLYALRGKEYLLAGDMQKALSDAEQSIRLHPNDARSYLLRGQIYEQSDHETLAAKDFEKAIELRPLLDECFLKRGLFLSKQGKKSEAVKDFQKAILLNPASDEAAQDQFEVLRELGDYPKSLAAANVYVSMRPQFSKAYWQRADLEFDNQDFSDAVKDLTYAIEIGARTVEEKPDLVTEKLSNQEMAKLYLRRANAYLKLGSSEQAAQDNLAAQRLQANETSTKKRSASQP